MGGLWELPGGDCGPKEKPDAALRRSVQEGLGLAVEGLEAAGQVKHVFTHRTLRLHVFRCGEARGRIKRQGFDAHRWLSPRALAALPHGGATRKALSLLDVAEP